jgi:fibronectin type 3 domain-containing protein
MRRRYYAVLLVGLLVFTASASAQSAKMSSAPGQVAPVNDTLPTITGIAMAGQTFLGSSGNWTGPSPTSSYQWVRCSSTGTDCTAIASATAQSYLETAADVGLTLRLVVTASNKNGSAVSTSNPTLVVMSATSPPPPTTTTSTSTTTTTPTITTTPTTSTTSTSTSTTTTTTTTPSLGPAFYVSPTGSDLSPGTLTAPWRTIGKAMASLQAGQTAYLRAGTYEENTSGSCDASYNKLIWTRSGTSTSPITISGYPGEEKQVIVKTAVRLAGSYQRFANVVADRNYTYQTFDSACTGGPSVQLYGPHATLSGVEVRNSNASGVYAEGAAYATVIGNWIHDNGSHWNKDHGVYWLNGPNSLLADNIVQNNYAYGIKIGPDAQSVLVSENTVNGNGRSGIIVSGDTVNVSNGNTIADNILTWNGWSSGGGFGLRTYWESAGVGTGNQAVRNLMYGNSSGNTWYPGGGMTETASIFEDPLFVNRAAGDFRLQTGSPAVDTANNGYSTAWAYAGVPRPQGAGPDLGAYER